MKRLASIKFWLVFTLLFIISWYVSISLQKSSQNDLISKEMDTADFYNTLPDEINNKIEKREAVVINIWATWCQPCRKEMPLLNQLAKKHPNVNFISVTDQSKEEAAAYMSESPVAESFIHIYDGQELINYIAGFLNQKKIKKGNAIISLPTNVIFYNNRCVFIEVGFSESNINKMDSILTSISSM